MGRDNTKVRQVNGIEYRLSIRLKTILFSTSKINLILNISYWKISVFSLFKFLVLKVFRHQYIYSKKSSLWSLVVELPTK